MSFRNRLALFLIATLIAVQASTALFAYAYLRHDLIERGKRELTQAMVVFQRQLDFLSERVTDGVEVLSLDYALRSAIARSDQGTELSALRNHGNRIGATRMILVNLDGNISADTAAPARPGVLIVLGCPTSRRGRLTAMQRWRVDIASRIFWPASRWRACLALSQRNWWRRWRILRQGKCAVREKFGAGPLF